MANGCSTEKTIALLEVSRKMYKLIDLFSAILIHKFYFEGRLKVCGDRKKAIQCRSACFAEYYLVDKIYIYKKRNII